MTNNDANTALKVLLLLVAIAALAVIYGMSVQLAEINEKLASITTKVDYSDLACVVNGASVECYGCYTTDSGTQCHKPPNY